MLKLSSFNTNNLFRYDFKYPYQFPMNLKQIYLNHKWDSNNKYHSTLVWNSCYIVTYVDLHLHTCTYICRIIHSDTTIKTQEGKRRKTSLQLYLPLTLFVRFACERVLEREHKLHILTSTTYDRHVVFFLFS